MRDKTAREKNADTEANLKILHKNVYTDLFALTEATEDEVARLEKMIKEETDQRRLVTRNLVANDDTTDTALNDVNERLRLVEKRLDNSAAFGSKGIQDAMRLVTELKEEMHRKFDLILLDISKGWETCDRKHDKLADEVESMRECEAPDCSPPITTKDGYAAALDFGQGAEVEGEREPRVVTGKMHAELTMPTKMSPSMRTSDGNYLKQIAHYYKHTMSQQDITRMLDIADRLEEEDA